MRSSRRGRVRALVGRIPRVFLNHRTPEGAAYGEYCRCKLARLGLLPFDLMPTLREAALIATYDLPKLKRREFEIDKALADGPNEALERELRRIERKRKNLRLALRDFERT